MGDLILGIFLLGCFSGVIPIIVLLLIIAGIRLIIKSLVSSAKGVVKEEKEEPVRNIREELLDETEGTLIDQFLKKDDKE